MAKAIARVLAAVGLLAIGIGLGILVSEMTRAEQCITAKVVIVTFQNQYGQRSIQGDQVLCATDWRISNVYGPTIEDWFELGADLEMLDMGEP